MTTDKGDIIANWKANLKRQIEGSLPVGFIYDLGLPSQLLLDYGIPNLPIQLSSTRLQEKAKSDKHPYSLNELENLIEYLQDPIAIFKYGDANKANNLIIDIKHDEKHFLIGLFLRPKVEGNVWEVNDIRNVFPKETLNWLKWIETEKAIYLNKEKIQPIIAEQRTNHAEVSINELDSMSPITAEQRTDHAEVSTNGVDLNHIAKLVNDFDNSKNFIENHQIMNQNNFSVFDYPDYQSFNNQNITESVRIQNNFRAIEILKHNPNTLTDEEKQILSHYSGFGGLIKKDFNKKVAPELQKLGVMAGEIKSIMGSGNTAYYTPDNIIDIMWKVAENLGFTGGEILEGSAGIGHILSRMPQPIRQNSHIQAIELDNISGEILKRLYPDAQVDIKGFQDVKITNESKDFFITNPPYDSKIMPTDLTDLFAYNGLNLQSFCIAKNAAKLRPGGIGIVLTSTNALDNDMNLIKWLQGHDVDIIGAYRNNSDLFPTTKITTDLLIFRKRINGIPSEQAIDVGHIDNIRSIEDENGNVHTLRYNRYFVEHPECVDGEIWLNGEMSGWKNFRDDSIICISSTNKKNMSLEQWASSFNPESITQKIEPIQPQTEVINPQEGQLIINDNADICKIIDGNETTIRVAKQINGHPVQECLKDYNQLKNTLNELLKVQENGNGDIKSLQDKLNQIYDNFVVKYGYFHDNRFINFLRQDADFNNVLNLENVDATLHKIVKADIFSKRVIRPTEERQITDVFDGVVLSYQKFNRIDLSFIAEKLHKSADDIKQEIIDHQYGFIDPITQKLEIAHRYLSGHIREKIKFAKQVNTDGQFDENIEALRQVCPVDIPYYAIEIEFGVPWLHEVNSDIYRDFIADKMNIPRTVAPYLDYVGGTWDMTFDVKGLNDRSNGVYSLKCDKTICLHEIIEAAINNEAIKVERTYSKTKEKIVDEDATQVCTERIEQIKDDFKYWLEERVNQDDELKKRIEERYNYIFNSEVPMVIDTRFLPNHFDGANPNITLKEWQKKAVLKSLIDPMLIAHEVGTGKTFTMVTTAMEMRRLGIAKKPMIVVQNATLDQFTREARRLYPNAKIISPDLKKANANTRQSFYKSIKYNDSDIIIIPQSFFDRIPDDNATMEAYIQDKIDEKQQLLNHIPTDNKEAVNDLKRGIERLKIDLKRLIETEKVATEKAKGQLKRTTDNIEFFQQMDIDALFIDEAHNYKHLGFESNADINIKGIDKSASKKAVSLFCKLQSVYAKTGNKNIVFATGTPISNTAAEIWTFMKYLFPKDVLKSNGIFYFDDFLRQFGRIVQKPEFKTDGKYKITSRFSEYKNVHELIRIFCKCSDAVLEPPELQQAIPNTEAGNKQANNIMLPQSRDMRAIMKTIREVLEDYEAKKKSGQLTKAEMRYPIQLVMYGLAQAAAIDARLVDSNAHDSPNTKINRCVVETIKALNDSKEYKGTVAIFCDHYQKTNKETRQVEFNVYHDIKQKLMNSGLKEEEIVIIANQPKEQKAKIFEEVNKGNIKVVIGSTQKLGIGVNIQKRLFGLINLDAPNRPMDYQQRLGRALRQGNMFAELGIPIRIINFGVEDSLDVTAYQRLKTKTGFANTIMQEASKMTLGEKINILEDRNVEEKDDMQIFSNMIAQLSGSQYALVVNDLEQQIKKLNAQKRIHKNNIILYGNMFNAAKIDLKNKETVIHLATNIIAQIKQKFPLQKAEKISILTNNLADFQNTHIETIDDKFWQKFNQAIEKEVKNVRFVHINDEQVINKVVFKLDDIEFNIKVNALRNGLFETHSYISFDAKDLGIVNHKMHKNATLKSTLAYLKNDILTNKAYTDLLNRNTIARDELKKKVADLQDMVNKPFDVDGQIVELEAKLHEANEAMMQELAEKDKKYAQIDSELKEVELNSVELNDEEEADEEEQVMLERTEEENTKDNLKYDEVEQFNARFNAELEQQIDGSLPRGYVYQLGMPSEVLQSTGIPNLPIRLQSSILNIKSNDPAHLYNLEEVRNLVNLIQKPIAIFEYGDKTRAENLIIGVSQKQGEGKQFLVGISIKPNVNGKELLINSVRNVFPKNFHDWIYWINQGKMLRLDDKETIKVIIDALRINPVDYISDNDLNSATKIIQNFENPQIMENIQKGKIDDYQEKSLDSLHVLAQDNENQQVEQIENLQDMTKQIITKQEIKEKIVPKFDVPYVDYNQIKSQVSLVAVLEKLGYQYNKKDGSKYPNYYLYDSTRKIAEHIIIQNPNTPDEHYFQGHNHQRKDLIGFVRDHLHLFPTFTHYKYEWQNVNSVLLSLNNGDYTYTPKIMTESVTFDIHKHQLFHPKLESLKYLYEKRQISKNVLVEFLPFIMAEKRVLPNGKALYNTVFPYKNICDDSDKITNLEIRNINFKGMAEGGDKTHSAWVATNNKQPELVKNIFLFESAIDAMSFYEIYMTKLNLQDYAFISTGGAISDEQIKNLKQKYVNAKMTCCFDNDIHGKLYDIKTWSILNNEDIKLRQSATNTMIECNGKTLIFDNADCGYKQFVKSFNLPLSSELAVIKPRDKKDFNDQLMFLKSQKSERKQIKY